MKKLLLLNPPGTKKYFRDYYCTSVSKAKYYYHPLDLVYLSGILDKDFNLSVMDCIAEDLSVKESKKRIFKLQPDYIIFLLSSPSYKEDVAFFNSLKKLLPNTEFIGTGDIYREYKEKSFILNQFLDAILLDFSTEDILKYLKQGKECNIIDNIIYRKGKKIYTGQEKHGYGTFTIPVPRWDLFQLDKYTFPFSKEKKYATNYAATCSS